jgi:hypothetical protein
MRRLGCRWFALVLVLAPARALACEAPLLRAHLTLDVPGAGVPTNAELRYSIHDQRFEIELEDARPQLVHAVTRELVPTTAERLSNPIMKNEQVFVVRPDTELAPQTEYRLEHFLKTPGPESYDGSFAPSGQPEVISSFRTGDGPDHVPPQFGGLEGISGDDRDSSGSGECSRSGYSFARYSFQLGSDESGGGVRYHVFDVGTGELPVRYASGPFTVRKCDSPLREAGSFVLVRAVDLAGNSDDNFAVRKVPLEATCSCICSLGPGAGRNSGLAAPMGFLLALGARAFRRRRSARAQTPH